MAAAGVVLGGVIWASGGLIEWPEAAHAAPASITQNIKIDQFGYLPRMRKVAVVADPLKGFNAGSRFAPGTGAGQYQVRRWADNGVVLTGTLQSWKQGATHEQSGDRGWYFDFSALTAPGSYYIFDTKNNVGSGRFEIAPTAYDQVLKHALRTFYYQRLNTPKASPYADSKWLDVAAYEGANQDRYARSILTPNNAASARDLSGGWMDAGDTNKYTTFAEAPVLQLLDAYRFNPAVFGDNLGIPESGNGVPDLLDELKWELEFLKKMQAGTGTNGFIQKVGVLTWDVISPLSADKRPRYYVPECTSSTLSGAAMFASAGVVFKGIPSQAAYGADLIARAEAAWIRAKTTTSNFATFQTDCDNQTVKAGDADRTKEEQIGSALIAAIHLYQATAKAEYKTFVESRYASVQPASNKWWGPYTVPLQAALLRYADLGGVTAAVASAIRTQKAGQNGIMSIADYRDGTDLYRAHMPNDQYHWGSNMMHAEVGLMNLDFPAFRLNPADAALYQELAEQHLHWLHGANPLGLSMLSNMYAYGAESSVNELFHSWYKDGSPWDNARTSQYGPAPGYLTGGPNPSYSGSVAGIKDQPPQKAYKDWNNHAEASYELSEPAIYYQAAYVQLLARLMVEQKADLTPPTAPGVPVASNLGTTGVTLSWAAASDNVGVAAYDLYNANGTLLKGGIAGTSVSLAGLTCGTRYSVYLRARDAAGNVSPVGVTGSFTTLACTAVSTVLYADAVNPAWDDWSWNVTRNYANASPVKVGSRSLRVDYRAWGGFSLWNATGINWNTAGAIRFWAYSATAVPLRIQVHKDDTTAAPASYDVRVPAKVWTQVVVTRAQLGNPTRVKRLNIQNASDIANTTVYLDQIQVDP